MVHSDKGKSYETYNAYVDMIYSLAQMSGREILKCRVVNCLLTQYQSLIVPCGIGTDSGAVNIQYRYMVELAEADSNDAGI